MFRKLFHFVKKSKDTSGDPDPGAGASQECAVKEFDCTGSFSWGELRIHLEIEAGIIRDAYAKSDGVDPQFMEMIGVYLEARRFERKEVLKILDMIPVKDEEENAIMRDIYNMVDEQLTE